MYAYIKINNKLFCNINLNCTDHTKFETEAFSFNASYTQGAKMCRYDTVDINM